MQKLIAIANTVAWSGFWAFGYLALSAPTDTGHQALIASLLAALGAAIGLTCWFQLVRHTEATGYAKRANRVPSHLKTDGEIA
jgi:drug/metabolite transporter (DMT)-like permease